ncbi:MAG: TMEM175 family protein [Bacteroidota bacterium]
MKWPHNRSRLEAFSDGVFAFAATLMVVNFDMDSSLTFTKSTGTGFLSFFVTFFVLVALWWVHYNFFRRTNYVDNWIIALNAILLFVVLYYVFPLKNLVISGMGEGVKTLEALANLFVMYGIGFLLIFLCLSLMYYRAFKKSYKAENALYLFFYARHFAIFVFIAVVSVVLAYFQVAIDFGFPGMFYVFLGPLCYWHSRDFSKKFELN